MILSVYQVPLTLTLTMLQPKKHQHHHTQNQQIILFILALFNHYAFIKVLFSSGRFEL